MSILAECPICHTKQKLKNKQCSCGSDLDKAKKSGKVNFWITYRIPRGKEGDRYLYDQRRELVGTSIQDARAGDGKRKGQKKENRIFDIKPESKMTFQELTNWYLSLEKVKALRSYKTVEIQLGRFNSEFGTTVVSNIKPVDLENFQMKRKREGLADATVDQQVGAARTVIHKAFDNDLVGGEVLKVFKKVKKLLKGDSNARKRILSLDEFDRLYKALPLHAKWVLAIGFFTGMRRGEILNLVWSKVSLAQRVIRLEATDTKDKDAREIPICDELYEILKSIPRAIHDDHVILFNGKPITKIKRALIRACRGAEITYGRFVKDGFIFHDLRHSFNTYMRKAGVQESVIMEITGHSTRQMFDRYNTVDAADKKEAVERFAGFLRRETRNEQPSNVESRKAQ